MPVNKTQKRLGFSPKLIVFIVDKARLIHHQHPKGINTLVSQISILKNKVKKKGFTVCEALINIIYYI